MLCKPHHHVQRLKRGLYMGTRRSTEESSISVLLLMAVVRRGRLGRASMIRWRRLVMRHTAWLKRRHDLCPDRCTPSRDFWWPEVPSCHRKRPLVGRVMHLLQVDIGCDEVRGMGVGGDFGLKVCGKIKGCHRSGEPSGGWLWDRQRHDGAGTGGAVVQSDGAMLCPVLDLGLGQQLWRGPRDVGVRSTMSQDLSFEFM